ncbi:nucleotide disphospho-sugar-binding domain-containing protein [Kibdelosporangium aridum]|uniref:nucleotide disphospho-sugar-binding domain-containing protein n=1 Tax=Kibdelosporangium aridum TaxID=2030 RepID=UPI0036D27304
MVALAWALRSGGHDVILATSGVVGAAQRSGLPIVDVASGFDLVKLGDQIAPDKAERVRLMRMSADAWAKYACGEPQPQDARSDFLGRMFSTMADVMADGTVRLAEEWQPDAVIYSPVQGAGILAAAKAEIPAVMHGVMPVAHAMLANAFPEVLLSRMKDTFARHGLDVPAPDVTSISIALESLRVGPAVGWPMRYIPFDGGGAVPDWVFSRRDRPRVAITLGTVAPGLGRFAELSWIGDVARHVDAEFVLMVGDDVDRIQFANLPANVRTCGWIPFGALLRNCSAVIHHGGAGTMLGALTFGLPQLLLPEGGDHFINAEAGVRAGLAMTADHEAVTADQVDELLTSRVLRKNAQAAADEMRTMPPPADLVPRIIELCAK